MITIVYPPGCYGHYIVKCLYYYTDLKNSNDEIFKFNENGSSHDIRENKNLNDKIKIEKKAKKLFLRIQNLIKNNFLLK